MDKKEAYTRIEKLKKLIDRHRYLYHVLDRSEISIEALDSLKKELFDLEQQFPDLTTKDSPTQRVSGKPLSGFNKVTHPAPMVSLNDAFSAEDMAEWLARIKKLLTQEERQEIDFYCELKIDGLAIELMYDKQIFSLGATRGDGFVGEDVTQNLKTVEAIPLRIETENDNATKLLKIISNDNIKQIADNIFVRGEVFLSKEEFRLINKEQEKNGLPLYANPRNIAAGSIRQLDPEITRSRRLDSYAYELVADFIKTHEEKHQILKILGFKTNPHNQYCRNLEEVFAFYRRCEQMRDALPYEIDGIVVIVNDNRLFDKLGIVGKAPRGAIALKFPLKQATTVVLDIQAQVGRTGSITPVAHLKPVSVGGTTITRATLHNEDEIRRLGIKIGDTVIVGRAGDVIPDIIAAVKELRTGKEKEFIMPDTCPSCGGKLKQQAGEAVLRCINSQCFARLKEGFYHFASRPAMNIVGLGPKIIDQLLSLGIINNLADLYLLKKEDLVVLPKFKNKKADNLVRAIDKSKATDLARFIYGLGIKGVGAETARDIADHFKKLEAISEAKPEDLSAINGIGPIVAEAISKWFQDSYNIRLVSQLVSRGINIAPRGLALKKIGKDKQPLSGKRVVLTGEMKSMTREEAKEKIRQMGGKILSKVSANADYLIVGDNPGSKLGDALKRRTTILKEQDFLSLINNQ